MWSKFHTLTKISKILFAVEALYTSDPQYILSVSHFGLVRSVKKPMNLLMTTKMNQFTQWVISQLGLFDIDRFPILMMLSFALAFQSCTKNKLSTGSETSFLSKKGYYMNSGAQAYLFKVDSDNDPGIFITQLLSDSDSIEIPKNIYSGDYGKRVRSDAPQNLDLIIRVRNNNNISTGDFYFESPVLFSSADISNVTTAVSWILRWGFEQKIQFSYDHFNQVVGAVEISCDSCRKKTVSEVVTFILSKNEIKNQILSLANQDNRGWNLTNINYLPPNLIYSDSSPNLVLNGITAKDSSETKKINIRISFINPQRSDFEISPDQWAHTFNSTTSSILSAQIDYTFDYTEKGAHLFSPVLSQLWPQYTTMQFNYEVEDKNRAPVCDSPLVVKMKANKNESIELGVYCRDYDPEDLAIQYTLISGPAGLTISTGGTLKWTVPVSTDNSPYEKIIKFLVNDSKLGYQEVTATLSVAPDGIPNFNSIPTGMTFSEGATSTYTLTASDPDGDPIVLRITPIGILKSGLPAGSSLLNQIVRTGSAGNYSYDWSFMPSWLQQIGGDGSLRLKISILYDPTDPSLNSTVELYSQEVDVNIINTDDPPTWTTQPTPQTVTEGTALSMVFLGTSVDPSPSATAVTYKMEPNGDTECRWGEYTGMVATSAGSAYFNGTPDYFSHRLCTFRIQAIDANGLFNYSDSFEVTVNDVNQPITVEATAPTLVTGSEMQVLRIDLDTIFEDPDYTAQDDEEQIFTYVCELDADLNGTYESNCDSRIGPSPVPIAFDTRSLIATWLPSATSAGNYNVRITVTDHGGISAIHAFQIQIAQAPAPMNFDFSLDLVSSSMVMDAYENSNLNFYLRARAATTDPIDNYNFTVATPICSIQGGGTCRVGLVATPPSNTGYGDTDLIYKIQPNFTDADAVFPTSSKTYILSFTLSKSDDATVFATQNLQIKMNNVNRVPTAIGLTSGSFGCSGSSANSSTSAFTVCIDASKDVKSGSNWSKKYNLTMTSVDADTTYDSYSYNFIESFVPTGITDSVWSFKLPSCINAGSSTVNRTFHLNLSDGRGGSVQRDILLVITKASAGGACMQ